MTPLTQKLIEYNRIIDLETYIENLIKQKEILENIERYTSITETFPKFRDSDAGEITVKFTPTIDFADIQDAYSLLSEEIERLQNILKKQKEGESSPPSILDSNNDGHETEITKKNNNNLPMKYEKNADGVMA